MGVILLVILCIIGSLLNTKIPNSWKYTFGFLIGAFSQLVLKIKL